MNATAPAIWIATAIVIAAYWLAVVVVVLTPLVVKVAVAGYEFGVRQLGRKVYPKEVNLDRYLIDYDQN